MEEGFVIYGFVGEVEYYLRVEKWRKGQELGENN